MLPPPLFVHANISRADYSEQVIKNEKETTIAIFRRLIRVHTCVRVHSSPTSLLPFIVLGSWFHIKMQAIWQSVIRFKYPSFMLISAQKPLFHSSIQFGLFSFYDYQNFINFKFKLGIFQIFSSLYSIFLIV